MVASHGEEVAVVAVTVARPEISRERPGCFLFLLDQSASMADRFVGSERSKAEALAFAVNTTIYKLVLNCMPYGEVRDYYHVGAIGYGGKGVRLAFGGDLEGLELVPSGKLAATPVAVHERDDGEPEPLWIVPAASGMTPMCAALDQAAEVLGRWVEDFPDSIPPIVLNVTDGQASDGHPRSAAERVRAVATRKGGALLFNLQLSAKPTKPVLYPNDARHISDAYARLLYGISSPLPPYMLAMGRALGLDIPDDARGFGSNADLTTLVQFLTVGTMPGNLK